MSLAISSDGEGRSGSGETQATPKVAGPKQVKYKLFHNLHESLFSRWGVWNDKLWDNKECSQ